MALLLSRMHELFIKRTVKGRGGGDGRGSRAGSSGTAPSQTRGVGPCASLVSVGLQREGRPGPLTQADRCSPRQLGQEGKVPLQSAHLYYNVTEKVRRIMESYFRLDTPLYFSYSHLVCRTAIEGGPPSPRSPRPADIPQALAGTRMRRRAGMVPFVLLGDQCKQVRSVLQRKLESVSLGSQEGFPEEVTVVTQDE